MAYQYVCRLGDIGIGVCPAHRFPLNYVTTFISGADSVFADNINVCEIGTIGISTCGHPTVALTGSGTVSIFGPQGVHRIGDTGINFGPYVAVTGSDNVSAED
jgi:hypothetical protein